MYDYNKVRTVTACGCSERERNWPSVERNRSDERAESTSTSKGVVFLWAVTIGWTVHCMHLSLSVSVSLSLSHSLSRFYLRHASKIFHSGTHARPVTHCQLRLPFLSRVRFHTHTHTHTHTHVHTHAHTHTCCSLPWTRPIE